MMPPLASRCPFSETKRIGGAVGVVALVVYGLTVGRMAFPGLPAAMVWSHLGEGLPLPVLYPLWGWLVRVLDHLPGVSLALAVNVFSALCGVGAVGLLASMMFRVRYRGLFETPTPAQRRREAQARRLAGWVGGGYLLVSIPFWVAATRSRPETFHLLLLLLAVGIFSQYQQQGRLRFLALLGVMYGVGLVESALFLLFLPVFVVRVLSEMYRFRVIQSWRVHGIVWGGVALGLCLLPLHLADVLHRTAALGAAGTWEGLAVSFAREYLASILRFRLHGGFIVLMLMAIVPWAMVFILSRRSPWSYDPDQVLVRVVFVGGLMAVLYDAPFSFWNLLGVGGLMLPAHALLAAGIGFMSGELWIEGARRPTSNASVLQQGVHWLAVGMVPLILVLILGAGLRNRRVVDTRRAEVVNQAARDIVDRLNAHDLLFANQVLGDLIQLEARERQLPLLLINFDQLNSPVYVRRLARQFSPGPLREALTAGDIVLFLDELLLFDEQRLNQIAFLDFADVFRGYGYLVPDGLLYRLVARRDDVDWTALVASQRSLWRDWAGECALPLGHPAWRYADQVRRQVGRTANDLGVILAQLGQASVAIDIFQTVLRIDPDHLSARMNVMDLLRGQDPAQADGMIVNWEHAVHRQERHRWALSMRYGYLLDAAGWAQRDVTWALSGQPLVAEAEHRHPNVYDPVALAREQFLDHVYLQWGQQPVQEFKVRLSLIQDERDHRVFQELVRFAIRRNDPMAAEAYLLEAQKLGLTSRQAAFDYAMIIYLRKGEAAADDRLAEITQTDPANDQAWLARLLWADPDSTVARQCLRRLHEVVALDAGLHLTLAWWHMCQAQWDVARAECETAVQLDPQKSAAWDLLLAWAQVQDDPLLAGACRQALRGKSNNHPLNKIDTAATLARQQNWKAAETVLRKTLRQARHPDVLHALATVIMEQEGDLAKAQMLLDEALLRRPFQGVYRWTRLQCLWRQDDLLAAEADRLALCDQYPDNNYFQRLDVSEQAVRDDVGSLPWTTVQQWPGALNSVSRMNRVK